MTGVDDRAEAAEVWTGFLLDVTLASTVVLLLLLVAYGVIQWIFRGPFLTDDLTPEPIDHVECTSCGLDLCRCPVPCPAYADLLVCEHGEPVCEDHRAEGCADCRLDLFDDAGRLDRGWVL